MKKEKKEKKEKPEFKAPRIPVLERVKERLNKMFSLSELRKKENYRWIFAIVITHMVLLVGRYIYCLIWIEGTVLSTNPLYMMIAALLPFGVWACTTLVEEYNYSMIKRTLLMVCIANAVLTFVQPIWGLIYRTIVMKILTIRITEAMTTGMVLNLARIAFILGMALCYLIIYKPLHSVFASSHVAVTLDAFKLDHALDMRPDKDVAYDINIMRDVKGYGKIMPLFMDDMFTHLLLVGPSGTGKTSSSLIPMLICLLERKIANREKREALLYKMVEEKKAYILGPVARPTEYDIVPFDEYKKEVEQIYKDYPDCGITFVSPNESIGNDVVKLCGDCKVRVNMLDPTKYYGEENVDMVTMQPFYVPYDMKEEDRAVLIVNQAKIFSETLITVNEASGEGGGEQYFRDLNTSVTSNIAIICMLWRNIRREQTNIGEIQECINDFTRLYPMLVDINNYLGLGITISDPVKLREERNNRGNKRGSKIGDVDTEGLAELLKRSAEGAGRSEPDEQWEDKETRSYAENGFLSSSDHSDENVRAYRFAVEYVNKELFMSEEKMFDQARGLRNLMNDMLSHPQVYKILNGGDNFFDFDRSMSRCDVNVLDTAIRISQQASTALGLFFLLNHKRAVLRRPENDRQPQFLIVDEATQYVHPWIEDAIGLYRQYRCSCTFSFQSLAQLDKTSRTRYIKGILLTVGNIIVYGRVGQEEMKTFETMGGSRKIAQIQQQTNRTSIFADTPTATSGDKIAEVNESFVDSTNLRMRGFQEVTWIGTIKGDVQSAKLAKLSFAKKGHFEDKSISRMDWSSFVLPEGITPVMEESGKKKNKHGLGEDTVDWDDGSLQSNPEKEELDPIYDKAKDKDLFILEQEHEGLSNDNVVLSVVEPNETEEETGEDNETVCMPPVSGTAEVEDATFAVASDADDNMYENVEEGEDDDEDFFI